MTERLPPMQAIVLRLRAAGKTRMQISAELDMDGHSVDGYVDRGLVFLRKHGLSCTVRDLDKVSDRTAAPRAKIKHAVRFRSAADVKAEIQEGLRCHCWLLKPCHDHGFEQGEAAR